MEFQVFCRQVLDGPEVQRGAISCPLSAARTDATPRRSDGFRFEHFAAQGRTSHRKIYSLISKVTHLDTHMGRGDISKQALLGNICII